MLNYLTILPILVPLTDVFISERVVKDAAWPVGCTIRPSEKLHLGLWRQPPCTCSGG